jgi:hypothetical protein
MHSITYFPLLLMMLIVGPPRLAQEAVSGARLIAATQQELQEAVGSELERRESSRRFWPRD